MGRTRRPVSGGRVKASSSASAGNHDLAAGGKMDSSEAFNSEADTAVQWTAQQLNMADRTFLASLPTEEQHGDFTLVHGSPLDPVWEYLTNVRLAQLNFDYFASRYCLVGHTHVPLVFRQPYAGGARADLRDHRAAAR